MSGKGFNIEMYILVYKHVICIEKELVVSSNHKKTYANVRKKAYAGIWSPILWTIFEKRKGCFWRS